MNLNEVLAIDELAKPDLRGDISITLNVPATPKSKTAFINILTIGELSVVSYTALADTMTSIDYDWFCKSYADCSYLDKGTLEGYFGTGSSLEVDSKIIHKIYTKHSKNTNDTVEVHTQLDEHYTYAALIYLIGEALHLLTSNDVEYVGSKFNIDLCPAMGSCNYNAPYQALLQLARHCFNNIKRILNNPSDSEAHTSEKDKILASHLFNFLVEHSGVAYDVFTKQCYLWREMASCLDLNKPVSRFIHQAGHQDRIQKYLSGIPNEWFSVKEDIYVTALKKAMDNRLALVDTIKPHLPVMDSELIVELIGT